MKTNIKQEDYHVKYGYCEIPKGLTLYRAHANHEIIDAIFFTTKYYSADMWGQHGVQIWKTKKKFKILFLISHITPIGRTKPAIAGLYYDIYPNEPNKELLFIDVKMNVVRREPFTQHLFLNYGVNGWLAPIEEQNLLEVCLFDKENINSLVELIEIRKSDENYKCDSLRKIKVFPNTSFFKKTKDLRKENANHKKHYKSYRNNIRSYVKECMVDGWGEADAKDYHYNLRLKLKI